MGSKKILRVSSVLIAVAGMIVTASCGSEKLRRLDKVAQVEEVKNAEATLAEPMASAKAEFCTQPAGSIKSNVKFVFVLDKSGSNQMTTVLDAGGNLTTEQGTDMDGARRYTPFIDWLGKAPQDSTIYYSLVNFSTDAGMVKNSASDPDFTNDRDKFTTLVKREANPANATPAKPDDSGWTNYLRALNTVSVMIDKDIKAAKAKPEVVSSYYVVIFVSDGIPKISQTEIQPKNDVLSSVRGLMAFAENSKEYVDSVQVHTGYYYGDKFDPAAQSYLTDMAAEGLGDAYQFGAGQMIDFSKFSVPTRNVKRLLRDVIVYNASAMWVDGDYLADADGDGLPDNEEARLGSFADKLDSDQNGVRDGVENFISGRPCKAADCSPIASESYVACNAFKISVGLPVLYSDLDKDGLNDCEERIVLGSKHDNFDSNGDWIPDSLAFARSVAYTAGTQEGTLDPDRDAKDNYTEIKVNTPLKFPNDRVRGLVPYQYNLEKVSDNEKQACYRLDVANIKSFSPADTIRILVMESTSVIDDKRFLRVGEKAIGDRKGTVVFTDADIK